MGKGGETNGNFLGVMAVALLGGAVSVVVALMLIFAGAFAVSAGVLSEKASLQITVIACVIAGYCGGALALRRIRGMSLLVGVSVGIVFCLILLTVNLIGYGAAVGSGPETIAVPAGCMCGSLLAGVQGRRKGRKKRKRKT